MKKNVLIPVLAIALVLCCVVGGSLAWLVDQTTPVKNTFTVGDINIDLAETTTDYKMVPGNTIAKDPAVTVEAGSEASWLFVKITESANFDDFMTYAVADGWTALAEATGVYYRQVPAATADTTFAVLKDDTVSVKDTVTKEQLSALEADAYPTLTFQAYAVQSDNVATAADAWAKL